MLKEEKLITKFYEDLSLIQEKHKSFFENQKVELDDYREDILFHQTVFYVNTNNEYIIRSVFPLNKEITNDIKELANEVFSSP